MTQETDIPPPSRRRLDARKLRVRREKVGLSQSQLGTRLKVHGSQVAHWERGDWGCTASRLQDLAAALDCTPDDLAPDPVAPPPAEATRAAAPPAR